MINLFSESPEFLKGQTEMQQEPIDINIDFNENKNSNLFYILII